MSKKSTRTSPLAPQSSLCLHLIRTQVIKQRQGNGTYFYDPNKAQFSTINPPGFNGQVTYAIQVGNEDGDFEIASNGTILTINELDRERIQTYNLIVRASDGGFGTRLSSTVAVNYKGNILRKCALSI